MCVDLIAVAVAVAVDVTVAVEGPLAFTVVAG